MENLNCVPIEIIRDQLFYEIELEGCKIDDAKLEGDVVQITLKNDDSGKNSFKLFFTGIDYKSVYKENNKRFIVNIETGKSVDVDMNACKLLCVLRKEGSCVSIGYVYEVKSL